MIEIESGFTLLLNPINFAHKLQENMQVNDISRLFVLHWHSSGAYEVKVNVKLRLLASSAGIAEEDNR